MNKPINCGDAVYVVAPANSINEMNRECIDIGVRRINNLGYNVIFGDNIESSTVTGVVPLKKRIKDINTAIRNENVSLIMPVYGGYNSNDLLPYLDYQLLRDKRITWCGYSDITAILNVLSEKTGIKMLHGPSFSTFCDKNMFADSISIFQKVISGKRNIVLEEPKYYAEDLWFLKPVGTAREAYINKGWVPYRSGRAKARVIGGNLETLLALAGTQFDINYNNRILFIETEPNVNIRNFKRDVSHLNQMGALKNIKGLIIGSFSKDSLLSDKEILFDILDEYLEEYSYPVLTNVCFSHIDPIYTIPIGAEIRLCCGEKNTVEIVDSLYD